MALAGFAAGAIIGLMWGQSARNNAPSSVAVTRDGAKVQVSFDAGKFVAGGLADYLQ
jgi:hypothetical protein